MARAAPSWLPKEARAEWRRVMPVLEERRALTDADLATVEHYCLAIGQVRLCQATLATLGEAGAFVQSERSAPRPHPAYRLMHGAMAEARRLAVELGLTPASRHRAAAIDQGEDDGWSGLVDG